MTCGVNGKVNIVERCNTSYACGGNPCTECGGRARNCLGNCSRSCNCYISARAVQAIDHAATTDYPIDISLDCRLGRNDVLAVCGEASRCNLCPDPNRVTSRVSDEQLFVYIRVSKFTECQSCRCVSSCRTQDLNGTLAGHCQILLLSKYVGLKGSTVCNLISRLSFKIFCIYLKKERSI